MKKYDDVVLTIETTKAQALSAVKGLHSDNEFARQVLDSVRDYSDGETVIAPEQIDDLSRSGGVSIRPKTVTVVKAMVVDNPAGPEIVYETEDDTGVVEIFREDHLRKEVV